jgi:hypothetical protein
VAKKLTAAQKAAAAKAAAKKKKDDAYAAYLANPITSPNDPRIGINAGRAPARTDSAPATTDTGSKTVFPKAGTILKYKPGKTGFRIAVYADGAGGEFEGGQEVDPDYSGGEGGDDTDVTLVSTEKDEYGNVVAFYSNKTSKIVLPSGRKYKSTVDEDAYEILRLTFKEYGLDDAEILKEIQGYMERGFGSERAGLELRKTTAYTTRFSGNEARRAAGLNVLSEDAYLQLEDAYKETLRVYGLQGYFGTDRKTAQSKMGELIGNDINAPEFKDRINTVVTRVNNADPNIKATLKGFYNITDTDLVKYFLSPKENLPRLQEKVTAAEIGNEALKQNLVTSVTSAENLAKLGITQKEAREGYSEISQVLPTASKLGQIYGEEGINYTQTTAEEERFGELESARRKRLRLEGKEIGTFSGSSGVARGALGSSNSGKF